MEDLEWEAGRMSRQNVFDERNLLGPGFQRLLPRLRRL